MSKFLIDAVDQSTYNGLKVLMGDEGFAEIIGLFVSDTHQAIKDLRPAIAGQQLDYISSVCHKMKSSSRLIGAFEMAKWCEQLEECTTQPGMTPIGAYEHLQAEFKRVEVWLAEEQNDTVIAS
ncbi:MAG: Hpt domain-containing protein [Thiolinea sp.]